MSIYTENKLLSTYKRESGKSSHYDYKLLEKILNKYRVKNHNVNYVRAVKFEFEYMIIIITYEFGDMSRDELSDNEIRQIFEKKTLQYHNISGLIARGVLKKPTYQRDIDDRRVNIISNYIISNFDKPSFLLGSLIISIRDKKAYIVDGLHRTYAIQRAVANKIEGLLSKVISVILLKDLDIVDEKKVFRNINLSLPVDKIVVHDDEIGVYVNAVEKFINAKWKKFISATSKCQIPNINIDMLKKKLVEKNLIKHKIENCEVFSVDEYISKILELNEYIGEKLNCSESNTFYSEYGNNTTQVNNLEKNIKKCRATKPAFYLGLIPKYKWVEYIFTKETM